MVNVTGTLVRVVIRKIAYLGSVRQHAGHRISTYQRFFSLAPVNGRLHFTYTHFQFCRKAIQRLRHLDIRFAVNDAFVGEDTGAA